MKKQHPWMREQLERHQARMRETFEKGQAVLRRTLDEIERKQMMNINTMQVSELLDALTRLDVAPAAVAAWFEVPLDDLVRWQVQAPASVLPALRALLAYVLAADGKGAQAVELLARNSMRTVIAEGLFACEKPATERLGG